MWLPLLFFLSLHPVVRQWRHNSWVSHFISVFHLTARWVSQELTSQWLLCQSYTATHARVNTRVCYLTSPQLSDVLHNTRVTINLTKWEIVRPRFTSSIVLKMLEDAGLVIQYPERLRRSVVAFPFLNMISHSLWCVTFSCTLLL